MKVREIVQLLEAKGIPLNVQQRAALENEGHRKMREIRDEMRSVVCSEFKVDRESIQRAAAELITKGVAEALSDNRVDRMVVAQVMKHMPPAKTIEAIVKEQLTIAAGIVAKEQIAKNVHVTFNEVGDYQQGGTFS